MSIRYSDEPQATVVAPGPGEPEPTLRDKLKRIADAPGRELSWAETAAVSLPGRTLLGAMESLGGQPISRGIVESPVKIAATASDLYLGAAQKTYELAGAETSAKEFEQARMKVRGVVDEVDQFNARQDKLFAGGAMTARMLRGASASVTDAFAAGWGANVVGAPTKGNALLMQYFATRSTQDHLRNNPDQWDTAIAHGMIDGLSVGLGEYINAPLTRLAGAPSGMANKMLSRAASRAVDTIPLPETTVRAVFGGGVEAASEMMSETANYFADVASGVEKLDWNKYGKRMAEAGVTAGLAGTSAAAVQPMVDAMRARTEAVPKILDSELARKNDDLHAREVAAGLVTPPVVEAAKPSKDSKVAKPTAEEMAQKQAQALVDFRIERAESFKGLATERKMFDLSVREARVADAEAKKAGAKPAEPKPTPESKPSPTKAPPVQQAAVVEGAAVETETAEAEVSDVDAELEVLDQLQREAVQLKRDLMADANIQSPQREALAADLEERNAVIAERLQALAEKDGAVAPELTQAATRAIPPKSRAQQRTNFLTKQVVDAKARVSAAQTKGALAKDALAFVRDALPASARGGLEAMALQATTPAKQNKFYASVDKRLAKHELKLANDSLAAAMKKADKYATRPEDRAKISDILSPIDRGPKRVREQAEVLVDYVKANPDAAIPDGYAKALEQASQVHKSELTAPELRQLADAIEAVAAQAAAQNTFKTIAKDQSVDQYAANVVSQIAVNHPRATGLAGELVTAAANIVFRPETIMASVSEDLRVLGWENIGVEGYRNQLAYAQNHIDDMNTFLRSIGLAPDRVAGATFQGGSELNKWRYEQRSIGGQPLTRAEALHIYGLSLDPTALSIMREGGATLQKHFQLRKKDAKINIDDGTLREIGDFIGDRGRQVVEHGFGRMNKEMRDAVNKQWVDVFNKELSQRDNYFPIRRDIDWVMEGKDPAMFGKGLQDAALDSYGEFGITKRRETSAPSALEVGDFFDTYSRHIDTTSRIHAYMGPVRDFVAVYGKANVKQAVENASSPDTYKGILEAVKQQVLPTRDPDKLSSVSRRLVQGSASAILGLRVITPFKNALGLNTAAASYANGEKMLASAVAQASNPANANAMEARLAANSPAWRQRVGNYANEATSGMGGNSRAFQPASASDAAIILTSTSDKFAGIVRGFMAESYVRDTVGIPPNAPNFETEVAKEWERTLYRTESTSHGMEMSGALRAGKRHGAIGSLVQFGSGSSKTLSLLQSGRNDIRQGNYKQGVRKMAAFGTSAVIDAVIGALFAVTAAGKEEELIDRIAGSVTRNIPAVGESVTQAYRYARGKKVFSGPPDSLQTMVVDGAMGAADISLAIQAYLTAGVTDEGDPAYKEHALKAADRLSLLVGSITKLPLEGGKDAFKRIANGLGIDGTDADDFAQAYTAARKVGDIKEPRNAFKAALNTKDDAMFLKAIEDIHAINPERLSARSIAGIVEGQFEKVKFYERNPQALMELSDSQLRVLKELTVQRTELRQTLQDMLSRNAGQIEEIIGVE